MLRLAFDFIITWRETRTRPNAYKIQGENTFFITEAYQPEKLERYARIVMQKGKLNYCIIGWCELWKNTYKAVFKLIEKQ